VADGVEQRLRDLGDFIREQRESARLSLRGLSDRAGISNPYLSQIERGLHEPSVRVLRSIARALNLSAETLLDSAGLLDGDVSRPAAGASDIEAAIRADANLTDEQKQALLSVYRSYLLVNDRA